MEFNGGLVQDSPVTRVWLSTAHFLKMIARRAGDLGPIYHVRILILFCCAANRNWNRLLDGNDRFSAANES